MCVEIEQCRGPGRTGRGVSGRFESEALGRATMMVVGPERGWSVAWYAGVIERARNDEERYRILVHDLLRRFRRASPTARQRALKEPPRLTGTRWDAMLAGAAEFAAILHGYRVPGWCDERERSLAHCWMPPPAYGRGFPGMVYRDALGAFLPHGVLVPRWGLRARGAA